MRVHPLRKPAYGVEPRTGNGSHGGGDVVMLADMFSPDAGRRSAAARGRRTQRRLFDPGRRGGQPLLRDRPDRAHRRSGSPIAPPPYPAMPSRTGARADASKI